MDDLRREDPRINRPESRGAVVAFVVGVVAWVAVAAYLRRPAAGDFVDDGQYLVSARSLRDGMGYRLPSRPGNPAATKYPIGTPALAAAALALAPGPPSAAHDRAAGRAVAILAGVILACSCRSFLRASGLSPWWATLLALATIWHPGTMQVSATLMSDLPFAAVSSILAARWARRWSAPPAPPTAWATDGLLAGAGWLIRGNGITLAVAALAFAATRKAKPVAKSAAVAAGIAGLWLPATLYCRGLEGPRDTGGYAGEWAAAYRAAGHPWSIPAANLARLPGVLAQELFAPAAWTSPVTSALARHPSARVAMGAAAVVLVACGLASLARARHMPPPIWVHGGLTILVFTAWHSPVDHRFLMPAFPLVLAAVSAGIGVIAGQRWAPTAFAGATLACSALVMAGITARAATRGGVLAPGLSPEVASAFGAIRSRTPSDAVIVCEAPELVYLNTGRVAAPIRDDDQLFGQAPPAWDRIGDWLRRAGDRPTFIALPGEGPPGRRAIDALRHDPRYPLIDAGPGLWRIGRDGSGGDVAP